MWPNLMDFLGRATREMGMERTKVVATKWFRAKQIVTLLRRIDALIAQCKSAADTWRDARVYN